FLISVLAHQLSPTIWVICPTVRCQELVYEALLNWVPTASFLPEAEFAAVENILPDPEIAAERLAVLSKLQQGTTPQLVVTTRAALDQAAPAPVTLGSGRLQLRVGDSKPLQDFVAKLAEAGYERAAQVGTRGQYAVRGGIVDVFSWQAATPLRIEFLADTIE